MKLKYLNPRTVNGKTYLFFRYKGKLTSLPPDQNSEAFQQAYQACLDAIREHSELPSDQNSEFQLVYQACMDAVNKRPDLVLRLDEMTTFAELVLVASNLVRRARVRSRSRGLAFDLNEGYIIDLLQQQNMKCAATGKPLDFSKSHGKRPNIDTASLDRIDSGQGYVRGNVRVVCFGINIALNNWGDDAFALLANAFVARRRLTPNRENDHGRD